MSRKRSLATDTPTSDPIARFEGVELLARDASSAPSPRFSFVLAPGSFTFLVGPQGAGKTRVIDLLSFAARPARGLVEVFGQEVGRVPPLARPAQRRRIGILFQDQRLLAEFSAFDNIALAARLVGRAPRDYEARIGELAAWVGLAGRIGEDPRHLSESERRRLCLARALINSPELLLLDEPAAGLSDRSAERLLRLVADVNSAGATVVVATRDETLATQSGAAVIAMDRGVGA